MARSKKVADGETKEAKSVRLAVARMPQALKRIAMVGNLAGSSYSFTAEQKKKIIGDLKTAVADVEGKFADRDTASASSAYTL